MTIENAPLGVALLSVLFWLGIGAMLFQSLRQRLVGLVQLPAPSTGNHILALDSLRGLAALWVALFHLYQWPAPAFDDFLAWVLPLIQQGYKAVPIFVVLSGFLIYRSLKRAISFNATQYRLAGKIQRAMTSGHYLLTCLLNKRRGCFSPGSQKQHNYKVGVVPNYLELSPYPSVNGHRWLINNGF